jgi:cell wall-associated NlpC family hydrolase
MKKAGILSVILIGVLLAACAPFSPEYGSTSGDLRNWQAELSEYARSFLGTPYTHGGSDHNGMDCSGLVARVYKDVLRLTLPRRVADLCRKGYAVPLDDLTVGDLLFFEEYYGPPPDHVGIYMGNGRFIHASVRRGVTLSNLGDSYYQKRVVQARRVMNR